MNTNFTEIPCQYENYPPAVVFFRASLLLLWLLSAAAVLYQFHIVAMAVYLVYSMIIMTVILARICANCDYYGRWCDTGAAKLSVLLFKRRGDRREFVKWGRRSFPYLIILAAAPPGMGVLLLIFRFSLPTLLILGLHALIFVIFIWTTAKLACPHCLMRGSCPFCLYRSQNERASSH